MSRGGNAAARTAHGPCRFVFKDMIPMDFPKDVWTLGQISVLIRSGSTNEQFETKVFHLSRQ